MCSVGRRDDAYLVSALDLVRELQHAHVARGTPPGADPWATRPGYGDFVRHTVEVARGATVVLETGATPQVGMRHAGMVLVPWLIPGAWDGCGCGFGCG